MGNFVNFYNSAGMVPVRQDMTQLQKHSNRRQALYRQLGIVPALVQGSEVLEFGPGSGDNAWVTSNMAPQKYQLVEGSLSGYQHIEKRIQDGFFSGTTPTLTHAMIETYKSPKQFDLVICEGLLPGQNEPAELLAKVAQFVKPGGALVITTATYLSLLPDVMRRTLYPFFKTGDLNGDVSRMSEFFAEHLATLQFVSRLTEDWVMDNVVHPWGANYEFSLSDAAEVLWDDFEFLGSNPMFYSDWSWYKCFTDQNNQSLRHFAEHYSNMELSFISRNANTSYNHDDAHVADLNCEVKSAINAFFVSHHEFWQSGKQQDWHPVRDLLNNIAEKLEKFDAESYQAIKDFLNAVDRIWSGSAPEDADFGSFKHFWGRGQQYLSAVKIMGSN